MTVYSTDLAALLRTVNATLVERVLPVLDDSTARLELGGVTELVANLIERVSWDAGRLRETSSRTEVLAEDVRSALGRTSSGEPSTLQQARLDIADLLAHAYDDPDRTPGVVDAVGRFTDADVADQISLGLRGGLPR